MIVLCNRQMTELARPLRQSTAILRYEEWIAAEYDDAVLAGLTEDQVIDAEAWWREAGYANITIELDREAIAEEGVFGYLCRRYGISTETNVALALGEMARENGIDPLELWDWFAEREPETEGAMT